MKTSTHRPTITKKYAIEVPTHTYQSVPSIFKVWFGKHYLIWKGKSLLQSCQFLAETIERNCRLQKNEETDQLYHVIKHIQKTRCIKATVTVLENEFTKPDTEAIQGYKLLVAEQKWLNSAKNDPLCLNNNVQAYIPGWISKKDVDKFLLKYPAK